MSVGEMSAIVSAWQSAVLGPDEDSDSQDRFALIDWGLARRSYHLVLQRETEMRGRGWLESTDRMFTLPIMSRA